MKKLLIISGKGGTGKTTVAGAFIHFAKAGAFADCDVEAPNLKLIAPPLKEAQRLVYRGGEKAFIDEEACAGCRACERACRFRAVEYRAGKCRINEYFCEGCGVCALVCPSGAVKLREDISGELSLYKGERAFAGAELKMGRGNSGKLVSEVKGALEEEAKDKEFAVIDGPPGIGCPVIASMKGIDLALVVTEPTVSGLSDLERILKTAAAFDVRAAVCVNKYDVSPRRTREIEEYCIRRGTPFTGRIPCDEGARSAVNEGKSLAQEDGPAAKALRGVFLKTIKLMKERRKIS